MKKTFLRLIRSLAAPAHVQSRASSKHSGGKRDNGRAHLRRPGFESLEDRTMLSADAITFDPLPAFNYSSNPESNIVVELEQTNFIELVKMNPGSSVSGKDLVSVDRTTGTISVFVNSGSATDPYGNAPVTTSISSLGGMNKFVALADMDADSIPDLLIVCVGIGVVDSEQRSQLQVEVYKGSRDGSFSQTNTKTTLATPFANFTPESLEIETVQVRDITGDGNSDLFVTVVGKRYQDADPANDITQRRHFHYAGTSSGFDTTAVDVAMNYSNETPIGFGKVTATQSQLQLFTEVISVQERDRNQQNIFAYSYNISSNRATDAGTIRYAAATPSWTKLANVDSDAQDEIVSGIEYLDSENVLSYGLRVSQVTSLGSSHTDPIGITPSTARVVGIDIEPIYGAFGDINNDGNVDIVVSDGTSYQILIGSRTGQEDPTGGVYSIGNYYYTVQSKVDTYINYFATQVGDFTGDGYQDVIAIGEKHALLLPGDPSHAAYETGVVLVEFPVKATNAVFGNFTGHRDGLTDFVISSGVEGTTIFLYQGVMNSAPEGQETLFELKAKHSIVTPGALTAGHFVSPSSGPQVDLAILRGEGNEIKILSFTGERFGVEKTIPLGSSSATDITGGDFNRDGYDDIFVANGLFGNVRIYGNNASDPGGFSLHDTISVGTPFVGETGSNIVTAEVGDFNGDGKLDFGVLDLNMNSGAAAHRMVFFLQTDTGGFTNKVNGIDNIVNLPKMKDGVYHYHMIFEDFDLDARPDVIVGLTDSTGDSQIVVYRNDGNAAGQFTSAASWLTPTQITGTIDRKTSWGMTTGFVDGSATLAATPGVVVVSGNSVYRIVNTTEAAASQGAITVLVRDKSTPLDNGQYGEAAFDGLSRFEWLNEWGTYYLEVWGNTTTNTEGITSFTCSLNYDSSLFLVDSSLIESAGFTLNDKNVGANVITVSGSTSNTNYGKDQHVLLFRVLVSPAKNTSTTVTENVGVFIPEDGYAVPVSSGFRFSVAPQLNGKNVINAAGAEAIPVYPVIYDLDDSGVINIADFALFIKVYNQRVENNYPLQKFDFNHSGVINIADFAAFIKAYNVSRLIGLQNTDRAFEFNADFPELWPQLPQTTSRAAVSAAMPLEETARKMSSSETQHEEIRRPEVSPSSVRQDRNANTEQDRPRRISNGATTTAITTVTTAVTGIATESHAACGFSLAELDTFGLAGAKSRQDRSDISQVNRFDRVFETIDEDDLTFLSEDAGEEELVRNAREVSLPQDRVLSELLA